MNIREIILQEMASLLNEELSERKIDYKTLLSIKVLPTIIRRAERSGEFNDLALSDFSKGVKRIKDYLDNGKVLLNIWASYCQPCMNEFKFIKSAAQKTQTKYVGLGVDFEQSSAPVGGNSAFIEAISRYGMPEKIQINILDKNQTDNYGNINNSLPVNILFVNGKPIKAVGAFKSEQEVIDFINQTEQKPAVPTQQTQPAAPTTPAAKPAAPAAPATAQPAFKAGDRVYYPKAGIFTVAAINGNEVTIRNSKGQTAVVNAKWLTKK